MIVKTPLFFTHDKKKLVKIAGNLRQENQRQTHWAMHTANFIWYGVSVGGL